MDVIVNGSIIQSDCQTVTGCSYGGQQSFALSYHLQEKTRLYAEVGQNVGQSNTPPGTYIFGGFYHQFGDAFGLDGGLRFGVSDHAASIGTTVGIVFGKRLRVAKDLSKQEARVEGSADEPHPTTALPDTGWVCGTRGMYSFRRAACARRSVDWSPA